MSDGFNWGLRPSGKSEPEPEKPDEELEDPFAFLTQLEPAEPAAPAAQPAAERPGAPVLPTRRNPTGSTPAHPTRTRPEPDLPATEAMLTPENPYRPEPGPVEPPARPFIYEAPPATTGAPPVSSTTADPTMVAPTAAQPTLPPSTGTIAIDAIFGESAFREYEDTPLLAQIPRPVGGSRVPRDRAPRAGAPRGPSAPMGQTQRILFIVAGALVAALILTLVFVLGTRMPGLVPAGSTKPSAAASSTPDAAPTTAPAPTAIAEPGEHAWNELFGGECLEPFANAWQDTYTVVDCAADHSGQLLVHSAFTSTSFPGADKLEASATKTCASTKVIDYPAASAYNDLQVAASYATTEQEWNAGFTGYYCFASRSTDAALTGSIAAAAGSTPAATTAP